MRVECSTQRLASSSSAFVAARPVQGGRAMAMPSISRPQLQVYASKGKQRMRQGGSKLQNAGMPNIPTPPVDPDNVEFVIFVRSAKLKSWMPLSVMKGGGPANMLVKSMENDLGKKLYGNTLIRNVAEAIYKDRAAIERTIKSQFPMFKATKDFEYGFKIRDKENPKAWYQPTEDLMMLPAEGEMEATPIEKVNDFFQGIGKSLGIQQ